MRSPGALATLPLAQSFTVSRRNSAPACVYRLPFSTCFFRPLPVSVKASGLGSSRKRDHTVFVILCCLLSLVFSGFVGVIWCIGTFLSKVASCSILYTRSPVVCVGHFHLWTIAKTAVLSVGAMRSFLRPKSEREVGLEIGNRNRFAC